MLETILEATGLGIEQCAGLLGISPSIFGEWATGQRPIPESYLLLLSDVLGAEPSMIRSVSKRAIRVEEYTPAIWYKFRGENLVDADRECVLLIRQLGHYQNEIEDVTGKKALGWKPLFEAIRQGNDTQAPPSEQGRRAARSLRESTALSHCSTGIGEVFRGNLRHLGILVIESPIPGSKVEGCSFYVGAHPMERPCIFANTYESTWFRRNVVLIHEIGHAIFDAPSSGASLDFIDTTKWNDLEEQRAQAFAQEALLPREVLHHVAQSHGIKWASLTSDDMALLVAETHVEQRTVARAAVDAGFVPPETEESLQSFDIGARLRQISERALDTSEYLEKLGEGGEQKLMLGKRTATVPSRPIRLPVSYVRGVVSALQEKRISRGKAAELLMIDTYDLESRFGDQLHSSEE